MSKWHKTKEAEADRSQRSVNSKRNLIFDKLEENITVLWNIKNLNMIYLIPLRKPTVLYLVY